MRRASVLAGLASLLAAFGGRAGAFEPAGPAAPHEAALRELYADYHGALASRDGARAAALLHENIVQVYARALALSKHAVREDYAAVSPHQKLISLYLRAAASPDILHAMHDGREAIAFMVRTGALRSEEGMSAELRDFTFQTDEAFAWLYAEGRNTNVRLRFAREAGDWKIDLTDLNAMADDIYLQSARMQNASIDDALLGWVQVAVARPLTEDIWSPPEKPPAPDPTQRD